MILANPVGLAPSLLSEMVESLTDYLDHLDPETPKDCIWSGLDYSITDGGKFALAGSLMIVLHPSIFE